MPTLPELQRKKIGDQRKENSLLASVLGRAAEVSVRRSLSKSQCLITSTELLEGKHALYDNKTIFKELEECIEDMSDKPELQKLVQLAKQTRSLIKHKKLTAEICKSTTSEIQQLQKDVEGPNAKHIFALLLIVSKCARTLHFMASCCNHPSARKLPRAMLIVWLLGRTY